MEDEYGYDEDLDDLLLAADQEATNSSSQDASQNLCRTDSGALVKASGNRNTVNATRISLETSAAHPAIEQDDYGLDDSAFDDIVTTPSGARVLLSQNFVSHRPIGQNQNLRQITLFGRTLGLEAQPRVRQSQGPARHFRADFPPEPPTHHTLNEDELRTWVYPLNLGAIRDYQFSIVQHGLFRNTLVSLPTGLGKTFIAATVMLNFYRWTRDAKIIFVAPTKPLASQQVEACLNVAGIPKKHATLLTGQTPPVMRESEWASKRLFFMTPQTLMNDLSKGFADPKSIVLLVVDEAHRATGDYAYVKAVEFISRFNKSFRVLALTATPGASVEGVQDIIDNLQISHIEIRTEESIDLRPYTHAREVEKVILNPSDDMLHVQELFSNALMPFVKKLPVNMYKARDPMSLTTYGLLKAGQEWRNGPGRHVDQKLKWATMSIFTFLQSIAHAVKLLTFHGIKPFYENLAEFRSSTEEKGEKTGKQKMQLLADKHFQQMMKEIEVWLKNEDWVSHPKMEELKRRLVNHFLDAGEASSTRAIVFSEFRDSAEEIVRVLNKQPMVKATVFVGQADSKKSHGMNQKRQNETIGKFKSGVFNVLVATSIGEEGLDIGQVDLIINYDASASPIRMLQRMGRTGRKRAGRVVALLMKGKEEENFFKAKDSYMAMQELISDGSHFNFHHELSRRIVPRDTRPVVDKRHVEIPPENTQDTSLPEPKKTAVALRKKASKKQFHMPDSVETGFVQASFLHRPMKRSAKARKPSPAPEDKLVDWPSLESVFLTAAQDAQFTKVYQFVPRGSESEETGYPNLCAHQSRQRKCTATKHLGHGQLTKRVIRLLQKMGQLQDPENIYRKPDGDGDPGSWNFLPMPVLVSSSDKSEDGRVAGRGTGVSRKRQRSPGQETAAAIRVPAKKRATSKKRSGVGERIIFDSDRNDGGDESALGSEIESLRPAAARRLTRMAPIHPIKQAGGKKLRHKSDQLEALGDDCTRTRDLEEEEEGADYEMDVFIVEDNDPLSRMKSGVASLPATVDRSSPETASGRTTRQTKKKSRQALPETREPLVTQGSDSDDLPDLNKLCATNANSFKNRKLAAVKSSSPASRRSRSSAEPASEKVAIGN